MIYEFSRTELLLGSESMKQLSETTIAVFGVGGVGSHCIEALARCGVGRFILVDNDTVTISNINRQSIALHSSIGQHKTKLMQAKIAKINPKATVITMETFVLPENVEELFASISGKVDFIIDAIDTVTAKLCLAVFATKNQIPIIASMGTGNKIHAELFQITDLSKTSVCPLCKVMRKELKNRGISHLKVLYSKEKPLTPKFVSEEVSKKRAIPGSISFVPPVAGLLIAGEAIRDILNL